MKTDLENPKLLNQNNMSRNDATVDLELTGTKLLDNSGISSIMPIAGNAAADKAKTPTQKLIQAKKVVDHSSDSEESSQVQAKAKSKQKAAPARNDSSSEYSSQSGEVTERSDNSLPVRK